MITKTNGWKFDEEQENSFKVSLYKLHINDKEINSNFTGGKP